MNKPSWTCDQKLVEHCQCSIVDGPDREACISCIKINDTVLFLNACLYWNAVLLMPYSNMCFLLINWPIASHKLLVCPRLWAFVWSITSEKEQQFENCMYSKFVEAGWLTPIINNLRDAVLRMPQNRQEGLGREVVGWQYKPRGGWWC